VAHIQQPLFQLGPRAAPLGERAEELLQYRKLLVEGGQLGFERLDAPSLRGEAAGDRGQLRRRKGARQRKRAGRQRPARTESGQAFQPLSHGAELGDEIVNQARGQTGCALLITGCALLIVSHRPSPF